MIVTNVYSFGALLFGVILTGGILAYPFNDSGTLPANDENKPTPFVIIDEEETADDGSKLICDDGICESVNQPTNQGDAVKIRHVRLTVANPFLRRPLLILKRINNRWRNAWRSRIKWVEIKRMPMKCSRE